MGGGWWNIPVTGIYYWQSETADGLILIRSNSITSSADLAFQIIAASGVGGATEDATTFHAAQIGETERLLTQPGPRGWNCGQQNQALIHMLAQMSIPARLTQWLSAVNGAHQNAEVNLGAEGGWTLYDCHFGLIYADGFDGLDLFIKARAGQPTRNYVRHWQPELPWCPNPWSVIEGYEMGFGLFITDSLLVMTAAAGVTEAQIEAATDRNCTVKTTAQMRLSYYT